MYWTNSRFVLWNRKIDLNIFLETESKWNNPYALWLKTPYEDCVTNPKNKECK